MTYLLLAFFIGVNLACGTAAFLIGAAFWLLVRAIRRHVG